MPIGGSSTYCTTMITIPRRERELSNIFGSLTILGFVDVESVQKIGVLWSPSVYTKVLNEEII